MSIDLGDTLGPLEHAEADEPPEALLATLVDDALEEEEGSCLQSLSAFVGRDGG